MNNVDVRVIEFCAKNVNKSKKMEFRPLLIVLVTTSISLFLISTAQAVQTVPNPPTGLSAIPISPTSVSLSWFPPQNNGSSAITHYKIEYKTPTTDYSVLATIGNVTSYNQTGLTTGKSYIYRVSAINSIGVGSPSSEASAVPTKIITVPSSPTNLNAYPASETSISISWVTPQDNGGSAITGYKIEYKSGSGSYLVLIANTAS